MPRFPTLERPKILCLRKCEPAAACSYLRDMFALRIRSTCLLVAAALALLGPSATHAEFSAAPARCAPLRKPIEGENQRITTQIDQSLFSSLMLRETNLARCINRLPPLKPAPQFQPVTQTHSRWMADSYTLSHTSTKPGWETLKDRLSHVPAAIRSGSENLALIPHKFIRNNQTYRRPYAESCNWILRSGSEVPDHTYRTLTRYSVKRLMESPGHRKNILSPRSTHHTASNIMDTKVEPCGTHFITQNFMKLNSE